MQIMIKIRLLKKTYEKYTQFISYFSFQEEVRVLPPPADIHDPDALTRCYDVFVDCFSFITVRTCLARFKVRCWQGGAGSFFRILTQVR